MRSSRAPARSTARSARACARTSASLELSRQLATINCDLKLDVTPTELAPRAPDLAALRSLYERLELRSLLKQLPEAGRAPDAAGAGRARAGDPAAAGTTRPC